MQMKRNLFIIYLTSLIFLNSVIPCNSQENSQQIRSYDTLGSAVYFRYKSNERWERYAKVGDYPDVMVEIGEKGDRIIFWRGASYRPFIETSTSTSRVTDLEAEQRKPKSVVPNHRVVEYETKRSFVDALVPVKGDGTSLMFDVINRYSHARIVENSPARVIVLWRYIPDFSNPRPEGWTEEYFSIYPDGTCYRSVKTGTETPEEYSNPSHFKNQTLLFNGEGVSGLSESWINASALKVDQSSLDDFNFYGFDNERGSYNFEPRVSGHSGTIHFEIVSDVENLAVFVKNWGDAGIIVTVNGEPFDNYKKGYVAGMDNDNLVLWFDRSFKTGNKVSIISKGAGIPVVRTPVRDPYKLELPVFPEGSADPGPFGAYYTTFKYWDLWDAPWRVGDYADVVVQFDQSPNRLVFWRGTSYVPHWTNDKNIWYNNEFCERRGRDSGLKGLCEPMNEHETRYTHVKIIQSNDARTLLHWRYAPPTLNYEHPFVDETGWGDYVDEYYYVYPDESSVRYANLYTSAPHVFHEYHEAIPVTQPGQYPDDILENNALSVANIKGDVISYDFTDGFPPDSTFKDGYNIVQVGLKGEFKPYFITESSGVWWDPISDPGEVKRFNQYDDWPAWPEKYRRESYKEDPVTEYKNYSEFLPSHTSLMHLDWNSYESDYSGPVIRLSRVMLNGMTNENDVKSLIPLARYWENPPQIKVSGYGYSGASFDKSQKAYIINKRVEWEESLINRDDKKFPDPKPDQIIMEILASVESPVINPCFVINNWPEHVKAKLYINGEEMEKGKDFRQGIEKYYSDWATKSSLIIWVRYTSEEVEKFKIEMDD